MELISYALDFASFFIQNSKQVDKIKTIILFGSAARNEATEKSDIDIFIDVVESEKAIEKESNAIKDKFYDSQKFKKYWPLLGIKNEINIIVGSLEKWKLKDSMLGSAITLYSHFSPKLTEGKNKAVIYWENIKNNSKRVMLNKKLFGFKHYEHYYRGLLEKYRGVKLGANVILIDIEQLALFLKTLRIFNAKTRIIRIFEYSQ